MKRNSFMLLALSVLSAALLSIPWLLPHLGALSLIGFVPLLCADAMARELKMKSFWLYALVCFLLWNGATTFWVCNATLGGGIFAVVANALQMLLVWVLFRLSAKLLRGGALPYIFLAAAWLAWERRYFSVEISWPWLTLGNAFASSTKLVQWYEFTGVMGGSLWVWLCNLGIFGLISSLSDGAWMSWTRFARWSSLLGITLVIAGPVVASKIIYEGYEQKSEGRVEVVIAQPNFDPYQKFQSLSQKEQNAVLERLLRQGIEEFSATPAASPAASLAASPAASPAGSLAVTSADSPAGSPAAMSADSPADSSSKASSKAAAPLLLVGPETFSSGVDVADLASSPTVQTFSALASESGANVLIGVSSHEWKSTRAKPHILARKIGDSWLLSYNSALLLSGSGAALHHKGKLVVGTEKTPYPKLFVPFDDWLSEKMGVSGVLGRCVEPEKPSALAMESGEKLGCAICYESIYGEHCAEFVREGAKFLTVITNDAWWGDTPGYRQHMSYSRLRAIELRRDLARCGNTGISCFIDQRGDVVSQTPWWQEAVLCGSVDLNSAQTFFARYGDVTGRVATLVFLLLSALLLVRALTLLKK